MLRSFFYVLVFAQLGGLVGRWKFTIGNFQLDNLLGIPRPADWETPAGISDSRIGRGLARRGNTPAGADERGLRRGYRGLGGADSAILKRGIPSRLAGHDI